MNAPVVQSSQSDGTHAATAPCQGLAEETSKPRTQKSRSSGSDKRKGETTLLKFFADNPGEELTIQDAAAKIGLNQKSAATYLARLRGSGVLERISVYRLKEGT